MSAFPNPRDHGEFFRALDETAELHRRLYDTERDRDHWRDLAGGADDAPVQLDTVLTRCREVIQTDEPITGPALAIELLSLAGTNPTTEE